jgi:hypothetical protein
MDKTEPERVTSYVALARIASGLGEYAAPADGAVRSRMEKR